MDPGPAIDYYICLANAPDMLAAPLPLPFAHSGGTVRRRADQLWPTLEAFQEGFTSLVNELRETEATMRNPRVATDEMNGEAWQRLSWWLQQTFLQVEAVEGRMRLKQVHLNVITAAYFALAKTEDWRVCLHCHRPFPLSGRRDKYCSRAHAKAAERARKRR